MDINSFIDEEFKKLKYSKIKPIYMSEIKFEANCLARANIKVLFCDDFSITKKSENEFDNVAKNLRQAYKNQYYQEIRIGEKKIPNGTNLNMEDYIDIMMKFVERDIGSTVSSMMDKHKIDYFKTKWSAWIPENNISHLSKYFSKNDNGIIISEPDIVRLINCGIKSNKFVYLNKEKGVLINDKVLGKVVAECDGVDINYAKRMEFFNDLFGDEARHFLIYIDTKH